jgi:hypothetical protein
MKTSQLSSQLFPSVSLGLATDLQYAVWNLSLLQYWELGPWWCPGASPFLGLPLQRPSGQSFLQELEESLARASGDIFTLVPASPALLPRFNFIWITSIELDSFSRSKEHDKHERNPVRLVMWYPLRKPSCFLGLFGNWKKYGPESTLAGSDICKQTQGSLEFEASLPRMSWSWRKELILGALSSSDPNSYILPSLLPKYSADSVLPRLRRSLKHCSIVICVSVCFGGIAYSWNDQIIKISE